MRNNLFGLERGRSITNSGDPIHIIYAPTVMPDGTINLVKSGEENTDDKIESYRMSTDLSVIIARYLKGDESVLNRYEGIYADLTQAPKDYRQVLDAAINAEMAFTALPIELRKIWNNDWRQWMAAAATKEWLDAMQPILNPESDPIKEEVKTDESEH